ANTVILHLDPLADEDAHRLLRQLTAGALHPALAALIVERAGGNPFYLEELVSLVGDAGVQTVVQLLSSQAGDLPTTLRGLVAARLDALSAVDRQVIDDAAVLGRVNRISFLVLMEVARLGIDAEEARALIESLAAREFLVLTGDQYGFR